MWLHYGNGNVPVEAYVNGVLVSDFKACWFGNAIELGGAALAAQQAGEPEPANTWFRKAEGWSRENATGEPIMNELFRRYQRAAIESN